MEENRYLVCVGNERRLHYRGRVTKGGRLTIFRYHLRVMSASSPAAGGSVASVRFGAAGVHRARRQTCSRSAAGNH